VHSSQRPSGEGPSKAAALDSHQTEPLPARVQPVSPTAQKQKQELNSRTSARSTADHGRFEPLITGSLTPLDPLITLPSRAHTRAVRRTPRAHAGCVTAGH